MKRHAKILTCLATGAMLLQFGGCVDAVLTNVFFVLGPLFL